MNKSRRPSLAFNAASNWMALAVNLIISLLLTPYVISHLGKTGFGIWTLIGSIVGYYGLLDLGVTSATTRYVTFFASKKDKISLYETISTALVKFIVLGLFAIFLSYVLAWPLSEFFYVPPDFSSDFRHVVILLGFSAGLALPGNVLGASLRAYERYFEINAVAIFAAILRGGLTVYVLSHGMGLVGIAYVNLGVIAITLVLQVFLCLILLEDFRPRLTYFNWRSLRLLLGYGAGTSILIIADILRFKLDCFVIGKWVDLPAVGVFAVAVMPITYMLRVVASGFEVLRPRFTRYHGEGETKSLQYLFAKSLALSSFLSFGLGTLIAIFGGQFIVLWVGQGFSEAQPVIWVLAISYAFALAQNPGLNAMFALNKHGYFALITIMEGIANVILSIILAPRWGILGVALGTALPMLAVKILIQPVYTARLLNISLWEYWRQMAPAMTLGTGLILISSYFPQISSLAKGYLSLALCSVPYLAAFGLLYLIADCWERKKLVSG
jgi:O-antigen/teichoic acid export membrane protein